MNRKFTLAILSVLLFSINCWADFPTTAVIDSFDRSNTGPPPSASWTTMGTAGLKVVSNVAVTNDPNGANAKGYWNIQNYGPDSEAFETLGVGSSKGDPYGVIVRWNTASDNRYEARASAFASELKLYRFDAGTGTQLGSTVSQTVATGDKLGISAIGSTITLWYKAGAGAWTAKITVTDATYAISGKIGMELWDGNSTSYINDFGGGSASVGSFFQLF